MTPELPSAPTDAFPRLVGDIGGTNARFGLITRPDGRLHSIRSLPCAAFRSVAELIEHYLKECGPSRPRHGALGIAAPLDGDLVRMTNREWAFSIGELRDQLRLARLEVINDFTALAMAIPALHDGDLRKVGGGARVAGLTIGLLGPGTGLGVSGLVRCGGDDVAIEGEGGHVTLAASNAHEAALLSRLAARYEHVSAERVLSGAGLVALYEAEAAVSGEPPAGLDAATISERGIAGSCALCASTLETFCAFLGTVASNLALTLGARGGIYIGGGIVPKLGDYFLRSGFRARFEQKGRYGAYLAAIPTYVIHAPHAGLTGAARLLQRRLDRPGPRQ